MPVKILEDNTIFYDNFIQELNDHIKCYKMYIKDRKFIRKRVFFGIDDYVGWVIWIKSNPRNFYICLYKKYFHEYSEKFKLAVESFEKYYPEKNVTIEIIVP